jgi:hypothetical protein
MKCARKNLPVLAEMPQGTFRQITWGGMTVEAGDIRADLDLASAFRGLPGDLCPCPHWGYVLRGRLRFRYADREEVYEEGDLYFAPPGHVPSIEAGTSYIEFAPSEEKARTVEAVRRNLDLAK